MVVDGVIPVGWKLLLGLGKPTFRVPPVYQLDNPEASNPKNIAYRTYVP